MARSWSTASPGPGGGDSDLELVDDGVLADVVVPGGRGDEVGVDRGGVRLERGAGAARVVVEAPGVEAVGGELR